MPIYRHRVSGPGAAGDLWTTTLHSNSASALSTVHTAWVALVNGFLGSTLAAMWPNEQAASECVTDQLDPITGKNVAQIKTSITQPGTGAGATISQRSAIVIGLKTIVPTRAGRGRMYWPPPDSNHLTPTGQLVGTDALSIATGFGARLTTFKATSTPVIYHSATRTSDAITTVQVGVILGTQRRRTNRVLNSYSTSTV